MQSVNEILLSMKVEYFQTHVFLDVKNILFQKKKKTEMTNEFLLKKCKCWNVIIEVSLLIYYPSCLFVLTDRFTNDAEFITGHSWFCILWDSVH